MGLFSWYFFSLCAGRGLHLLAIRGVEVLVPTTAKMPGHLYLLVFHALKSSQYSLLIVLLNVINLLGQFSIKRCMWSAKCVYTVRKTRGKIAFEIGYFLVLLDWPDLKLNSRNTIKCKTPRARIYKAKYFIFSVTLCSQLGRNYTVQ
jgi:hypothetical protein